MKTDKAIENAGTKEVKHRNKQFHNMWNDKDFEICKTLFYKGYSVSQIAKELNRTNHSVYNKLKREGLTKELKGRNWTEEEDAYLSDAWGVFQLKSIATRLHRTEAAIMCRVHHLKLGGYFERSYQSVTLPELMNGMGITRAILETWKRHGLKTKAINVSGKQVTNNSRKVVYLDDLMEWLEKNQDLWDASRVESYFFVDKPDWMKDKFKADEQIKLSDKPRYGSKWSDADINRVKVLYMRGYSIEAISKEIGRTVPSIKNIVYKKGIKVNRVV